MALFRKKIVWTLCAFLFILLSIFGTHQNNVFATNSSKDVVETALFGNVETDDEGCGVFLILNTVVDILSIGIGITGLIGITIFGIQYLTANGDTTKVAKARRRMFEIIVGLVAYALLYAGAQWLLPGGKLNFGHKCNIMSDAQLADIKANEQREIELQKLKAQQEREAKKAKEQAKENNKAESPVEKTKSYNKCMKYAAKVVKDKGYCKITNPAERISKVARLFAGSWYKANQYYISAMREIGSYGNGGSAGQKKGNSCDVFVHTVLRASGVDPNVPNNNQGSNTATLYKYFSNHPKKWKKVSPSKRTEGDVTVKPRTNVMGHTSLVIRNKNGKLVTAEASNPGNSSESGYPKVQPSLHTGDLYSYSVWRYIGD